MPRLLLVCILACGIFGSVAAYHWFSAHLARPTIHVVPVPAASGNYSLELTFTCALAADPFVLDQKTALLVQLGKRELTRLEEPVPHDAPLLLRDIEGLTAGRNLIYVRAIPAADEINFPQALRISVQREGVTVGEQTLWSKPGEAIAGEMTIELPASGTESGQEKLYE